MMLRNMAQRVASKAREREREAAERIAQRITGTIDGVEARAEPGRIVVSGARLRRRWLEDSRLRFIGELAR